MNNDLKDIWIFSHYRDGELDRETLGLISEARRLTEANNKEGGVSIVALGTGSQPEIKSLGKFGVDRLLYVVDQSFNHYQGELFAENG